MSLNITVNEEDSQCRILMEGDVDAHGAEEMKKRFHELPHRRLHRVVVDFKAVTHIGSAGIGKLLVLYKDLAVYNARLHLVNVPGPIYKMLCEMKLNGIFTIEPSAN